MTDVTTPIEVNASPVPDQLWAGVRQIVPLALTFAIGRHWIPDDAVPLATAVISLVLVWGQLKTRKSAVKLASVAADSRVPDEVITTKGAGP